jgi:hypothetical protein
MPGSEQKIYEFSEDPDSTNRFNFIDKTKFISANLLVVFEFDIYEGETVQVYDEHGYKKIESATLSYSYLKKDKLICKTYKCDYNIKNRQLLLNI